MLIMYSNVCKRNVTLLVLQFTVKELTRYVIYNVSARRMQSSISSLSAKNETPSRGK